MSTQAFADVPTAIEEIRAGRMIVVVDDEDRENEGDITLAAEKVTPEAINFMAKYGRGLVCLTMTEERLDSPPHRPHERREHIAIRHGILRSDRRARGRDHRHLRLRSRAHHSGGDRSRRRKPQTWRAPATSSLCAPAKAECWSAPDRPKPPSIWRGSRD